MQSRIEKRVNRGKKLLDLSSCRINDGDIPYIMRYLKDNPEITTLNVGFNGIGAEGAKALSANTTLTTLYVGYNDIGAEGAKNFVNALTNNTTLLSLTHSIVDERLKRKIEKILKRNQVKPWLDTLMHARLLAQARRSPDCPLGTLPLEIAALINDYVVGAHHCSFFLEHIEKRPTEEDFVSAQHMALS